MPPAPGIATHSPAIVPFRNVALAVAVLVLRAEDVERCRRRGRSAASTRRARAPVLLADVHVQLAVVARADLRRGPVLHAHDHGASRPCRAGRACSPRRSGRGREAVGLTHAVVVEDRDGEPALPVERRRCRASPRSRSRSGGRSRAAVPASEPEQNLANGAVSSSRSSRRRPTSVSLDVDLVVCPLAGGRVAVGVEDPLGDDRAAVLRARRRTARDVGGEAELVVHEERRCPVRRSRARRARPECPPCGTVPGAHRAPAPCRSTLNSASTSYSLPTATT